MDFRFEMMEKYRHRFTVTCQDMNKDYRLSPAAVLLYFQESYARFMGCLHLAAFDLAKEHRMWIITEMSAEMTEADTFWGDDIDIVDNYDFIYAQMKNLRKRLSEAQANIEISTVHGYGYKLERQ